jgi:insulysin
LAKNSGSSNAYTATTNTNYHFAVGPPALKGALERFSGFFHSPLFAPSCTLRELSAVDSEHKKNHQNDIWRIFQLNKYLSRPGHVWSKFGTGSRETLERAARDLKRRGLLEEGTRTPKGATSLASRSLQSSRAASPALSESEADGGVIGRETRRRLVEWWSKEYCASRMHLAVIGQGKFYRDISHPLHHIEHLLKNLWTSSRIWSYLFLPQSVTGSKTPFPPSTNIPSARTSQECVLHCLPYHCSSNSIRH